MFKKYYICLLMFFGVSIAYGAPLERPIQIAEQIPWGAYYTPNGTSFKVWAPMARDVSAVIDAPDAYGATQKIVVPLTPENGVWFGVVDNLIPNQKYWFRINTNDGFTFDKQDPYARRFEYVQNGIGASILVDQQFTWTGNNYVTPRFENMVIYEVHGTTFCGNNDGLTFPCTFTQIEAKIPYLKSLGINMLQFMPLSEFPGSESWGYNPAGFFAPESSLEPKQNSYYALKKLINKLHENGIGVIIDVVYNHTASEGNYLWNFDSQSNIYFDWGIETPWGHGFAFGKMEVRQFLINNALFWLTEMNSDGLRLDMTNWITAAGPSGDTFLQELTAAVKQVKPSAILIAEHLPNETRVTQELGFNSQWFVDFHHTIEAELKKPSGQVDLNKIQYITGLAGYPNATNLVKYVESHDETGKTNGKQRFVQEFGGRNNWWARRKSLLAASVMLTAPGIPMLFMGQEFMQDGMFHDTLQYSPNWAFQRDRIGQESFRAYQALISTRWLNEGFRSNSISWTHVDWNNKIIAFIRGTNGMNPVLTVLNFSDADHEGYALSSLFANSQWQELFNLDDIRYGGTGMLNPYAIYSNANGQITVNIPKWSAVIFSKK